MKLLGFVLIVRSRSVLEITSETVQKSSQETLSSCVYIHILNNSFKRLFKLRRLKDHWQKYFLPNWFSG